MSEIKIITEGKYSWAIRGEKGRFQRIPVPKFHQGQLILDKKDNDVVQVESRSWTKERGWVYSINYTKVYSDHINQEGGSSCWWDENKFTLITDYLLKLKAEIFYRKEKKRQLEWQTKQIGEELSKLQYTFKTITSCNWTLLITLTKGEYYIL